jgi:hypothetical protein
VPGFPSGDDDCLYFTAMCWSGGITVHLKSDATQTDCLTYIMEVCERCTYKHVSGN